MNNKIYENSVISEQPNEGIPDLYENLVTSPEIQNTDFGGSINNTIVPVQRIIRKTLDVSTGISNSPDIGYVIQIEHGLGTAYEVNCRYRNPGDTSWQTFPTNFDADGTVAGFTYVNVNYTDERVTEIDFHLDVSTGFVAEFELVYLLWN